MTPANKDIVTGKNVAVTPTDNNVHLEADDAIHEEDPLGTLSESMTTSPDDVESPASSPINTVRALAIIVRTLAEGINTAVNDPDAIKVPFLRPPAIPQTLDDDI